MKMDRLQTSLLLIFAFASVATALICLQCDTSGDERCTTVQRCQVFPNDPDSTEVCQNDYRIVNNEVTIRKKCKQRAACIDEVTRKDNNCDEHGGRNTVCRCCCDTDNCNSLSIGCIYPSQCIKPVAPKNGERKCPPNFKVRTSCTFFCNPGFELDGNKKTTCTRLYENGTLGLVPPTIPKCVKKIIRCLPPHKDPLNGRAFCSNAKDYKDREEFNYEGSRCKFRCNEHFRRVGAEISICKGVRGRGKWSAPAPKCVRGKCPPLPVDKNRIDECSDGVLVGSECQFECRRGYKLMGRDENECIEVKGKARWNRPPPKCVKIICEPVQKNPSHGSVSCTRENFEGSECTFKCDEGYDMDDTTKLTKTITCDDDGDGDAFGEWSDDPATCTRILCLPQLTTLKNGGVKCSNKNYLQSVCTFTCDYGYDIKETTKTKTLEAVCVDDGDGDSHAEWDREPPTCVVIICQPEHEDPENGEVDCSNRNRLGSICTFTCNKGYDLDGTAALSRKSTCEDDGNGDEIGRWKGPPGTCTVKLCKPPHEDPDNGEVSCTAENREGSRCTFVCDDGYDLVGKKVSTCEDRELDGDAELEWSSKAPVCVIGNCKLPKIDEGMIKRTCGKGPDVRIVVGTVCIYECAQEGHYLTPADDQEAVIKTGKMNSECLADKTWSKPPPKCHPVTCVPPMTAPANGFMPTCTDGNKYTSVCDFKCKNRYVKTHDNDPTCESDDNLDEFGKWSHKKPGCKLNECDDWGQIPFGSIDYTDGFKIGSIGHVNCDVGYTTKAYENITCMAPDTRNKDPFWNRRRFVCCVKCAFNPNIIFVMVVDRTMTQSRQNWRFVVDFMQYVLYSLQDTYSIDFAFVLYDDDVIEEDSIQLTTITEWEIIDEFLELVERQYDAPEGSGGKPNTAKAITYAGENMFKKISRNEPYMVVITNSAIDSEAVQAASEIRSEDISILSVGFQKAKKAAFNKERLELAGSTDNIFDITSTSEITAFRARMTAISIENGCAKSSKSSSCPRAG